LTAPVARRAFPAWAIVAAALLLGAVPAHAQRTTAPAAAITPLEMRACRYAEDKGAADLEGLARTFNRWLTDNHAPDYQAYVLTPIAYSSEADFDLEWLGWWPDGTTMGESMAQHFTHGAELDAAFDAVMHCNDDRNYSTVTMRAPPAPGRFGPLELAACTLRLGVSLNDVLPAVKEWLAFTASYGSTAAHWLLFPAYGERSDAKYNFKWAVGYESYEAFGREYDQVTNGDGLDRYNELFQTLLRCDSPRLYGVRAIRTPQP
jgi:hypothetical protein